jgi:hypothetical protein
VPPPHPHPYHPGYWPAPYWPGYWAGVATGVAIGELVYALPAACVEVVVNGATYEQCGATWYRPSFEGGRIVYVIVAAPQ